MKGFRSIFRIAVIGLLAAGIIYLGYVVFYSFNRQSKDPVQAIPDRTALIIRVNNPLGLLGELTRNNLIWKDLYNYPGIRPIQEQLILIDSMSRKSTGIRDILKESPLTIALSLHSRSAFDPLFLISAPASMTSNSVEAFFRENYPKKITILQSPYGRTKIFRIHFENRNSILYTAVLEGVCIFSFTDALVKRAIDQLSLNTSVSVMKGFSTVASITGNKADANIYVNFPYLSLAIWKRVNEKHNKGLVKFARYADWSGLDLSLKKDEVLLTGYTIASDSAMQTLALMSDQIPLQVTMTNVLPAATQAYLIYALADYPEHVDRWQARLQRAAFSTAEIDLFSDLDVRYKTNVRRFLEPWFSYQTGRCWVQLSPGDKALTAFTVLQSPVPDSARRSLLELSGMTGKRVDSILYHTTPIYKTGISEALNIWLNPLFNPTDLSCFAVLGDFICFADNPDALKWYIDHSVQGEQLPDNREYQDISGNVSDHANISFYFNSRYLLEKAPEVLSAEYLQLIAPVLDSLRKFQSVTMQLSAEEDMFYTTLQLKFNPNRRD